MSHTPCYTYSMKIEMTEEQYSEIRAALIIARCELESSLEDLNSKQGSHSFSCLAELTRKRLTQIDTALNNSTYSKLKIS